MRNTARAGALAKDTSWRSALSRQSVHVRSKKATTLITNITINRARAGALAKTHNKMRREQEFQVQRIQTLRWRTLTTINLIKTIGTCTVKYYHMHHPSILLSNISIVIVINWPRLRSANNQLLQHQPTTTHHPPTSSPTNVILLHHCRRCCHSPPPTTSSKHYIIRIVGNVGLVGVGGG